MEDLVARFSYLAGTWLDDYERKLFDGKTIREIETITHER